MPLTRTDVLTTEAGANCQNGHINKAAVRRLLVVSQNLADDLLELHNRTGISLDNWASARTFVEAFNGPITENHA